MTENFPNLAKELDIQVQEAQRVPNKRDSNRLMPRYIKIKILNVKERLLKVVRERQPVTDKATP